MAGRAATEGGAVKSIFRSLWLDSVKGRCPINTLLYFLVVFLGDKS